MSKLRMIVDMDGVLADTTPLWLTEWNDRYSDVLQMSDITDYAFGKFVADKERFFALLDQCRIFERALPMPGAIEAIGQLHQKFHIIVASYSATAYGITQKTRWLNKWCPFLDVAKQAVFISPTEKTHLAANYLVEDNPTTFLSWASRNVSFVNEGAYLIDQPYNQHVETDTSRRTFRVKGLSEVAKELCR